MTPITLVLPYYENAGMLTEQFRIIRELPAELRDLLHVVIVDDGSPKRPAAPQDLNGVALQIYRIDVDVRWNQDAARNIGVSHAETHWIFLTDIDHVVPEKTWRELLLRRWKEETVYQFERVSAPGMERYKPHPNTWFMTRRMYDEVGGYDERFAGFYGTDGDFKNRLLVHTPEFVRLKEHVIRYPRTHIHDASTTSYLRKQPEDKTGILRILEEREAIENWKPVRGRFPYHRVHPTITESSAR